MLYALLPYGRLYRETALEKSTLSIDYFATYRTSLTYPPNFESFAGNLFLRSHFLRSTRNIFVSEFCIQVSSRWKVRGRKIKFSHRLAILHFQLCNWQIDTFFISLFFLFLFEEYRWCIKVSWDCYGTPCMCIMAVSTARTFLHAREIAPSLRLRVRCAAKTGGASRLRDALRAARYAGTRSCP